MFQLCIPRTDEFICAYGDESMCCMTLGCIAVQVDEECLFNKTSPMHVTMWMANMQVKGQWVYEDAGSKNGS